MITERPLREVPTRALYALHRGIERQPGLIADVLIGMNGVCAIGSLLPKEKGPYSNFWEYLDKLGIRDGSKDINECEYVKIQLLNDEFEGTPQERREYMLRLIVEELRHRGKALPRKSEKPTKILTHG